MRLKSTHCERSSCRLINGNLQVSTYAVPFFVRYELNFLPSRNKPLKKLLHFYWEICPKYDENGKLKQEMIVRITAILHLP